jgi:DNA-binding transcriptional ArsR family regulator
MVSFNHMVERSGSVLDHTYGALAHRIRRAMLDELRERSLRVTDLARPFPVSLAAASKHVAVLEAAGLVSRSVEGRDHLLSLNPQPLAEARDWIETYRAYWESRLDALEAHFRNRR